MELTDLQNIHKDRKAIFVAGAGPSLHWVEPERLKDEIVISVNSSLGKLAPVSNYFVSDDIGVKNWSYYLQDLPKCKATCLLFEDKLKNFAKHINPDRIIWFKHKWWYSPPDDSYNPDGLIMTKDASAPIIGARTSLGTGVHFAYIMGGPDTKIVLLGSDCCYFANYRYYWQFPGERRLFRVTGEPVFSRPNKGNLRGRPVDSHCCDFLDYWEALLKEAAKLGVEIIDASGGIMEGIKKMTFDDVLEQYGESK